MNAKTPASRFRGGTIIDLGLAVMEETRFDERKGPIMKPGLSDYHVPVHLDVPEIEVMGSDIPDPRTPMGMRGIGRSASPGPARRRERDLQCDWKARPRTADNDTLW